MPIRIRGNSYQVDVFANGRRLRATCSTLDEAKRKELELKLELSQGKVARAHVEAPRIDDYGQAKGIPLSEAVRLTVALRWKGTKGEHTATRNAYSAVEILGRSKNVADITTQDIDQMILQWESMGNSGGTINRKLAALSVVLKLMQDRGHVHKMPKLTKRKENEHRIRWITDSEEVLILGTLRSWEQHNVADLVTILVDTGFRLSEALNFSVADFSNGLLHLHAGQTKNGDARAVPATKRVSDILGHYQEANCLKPFGGLDVYKVDKLWDRLRSHLKLDHDKQFVVHCLRHTCASRLIQRGVPLAVVQKWMGHKAIQTTLRYAHLAPDNFKVALEALEQQGKGQHLKLVNGEDIGDF